jgi:hypothetical protein
MMNDDSLISLLRVVDECATAYYTQMAEKVRLIDQIARVSVFVFVLF